MKIKLAVIAAALMLLCAAIVGPVTAAVENTDDKIIHVSGEGKVTTTPDRAIISLAVETENADVKVSTLKIPQFFIHSSGILTES